MNRNRYRSHDDRRPTENIDQKSERKIVKISICVNERLLCYLIRISIRLELLLHDHEYMKHENLERIYFSFHEFNLWIVGCNLQNKRNARDIEFPDRFAMRKMLCVTGTLTNA